jgi:hypothetical protein
MNRPGDLLPKSAWYLIFEEWLRRPSSRGLKKRFTGRNRRLHKTCSGAPALQRAERRPIGIFLASVTRRSSAVSSRSFEGDQHCDASSWKELGSNANKFVFACLNISHYVYSTWWAEEIYIIFSSKHLHVIRRERLITWCQYILDPRYAQLLMVRFIIRRDISSVPFGYRETLDLKRPVIRDTFTKRT